MNAPAKDNNTFEVVEFDSGTLYNGDCLDVMATLSDNSVDAVITDPPYGLSKEPKIEEVLTHWMNGDDYHHTGGGFMGKTWDSFVPGPASWKETYRVLKPGGIAMVFGGTRTFDLTSIALRMAGFKIADCIMYCFGSGFPKSLSIGKAIDKAAGKERAVAGEAKGRTPKSGNHDYGLGVVSGGKIHPITAPASPEAARWEGWGSAIKPAHEPILICMKPLAGTYAQNALKWGVAGFWIDGGRIPSESDLGRKNKKRATWGAYGNGVNKQYGKPIEEQGRWPANFIHDGSDDVLRLFPETGNGYRKNRSTQSGSVFHNNAGAGERGHNDQGSAARFFYTAKASKSERAGAKHPTIKPLKLMEYLAKLTKTPTGGVVLDPYAGSGTTAIAADMTGRKWIAIEKDPDNFKEAAQRIEKLTKKQRQLGLWAQ